MIENEFKYGKGKKSREDRINLSSSGSGRSKSSINFKNETQNTVKQYVQTRIEAKNNSQNLSTIFHNLRIKKTINQINDNDNILIYGDEIFDTNEKILEQKLKIFNDRNKLIKQHNDLYKKKMGQGLRKFHSSIAEGVITFSPERMSELQSDPNFKENFVKYTQKAVADLCKLMKTEPIYISIHLDEKTAHAHFSYKNFNDKANSITYQAKRKKTLSALQDSVANSFGDLGFERGIKKEITNRNYQKTKTFKERQLRQLNKDIVKLKKDAQNVKLDVSSQKKSLSTLQKEYLLDQSELNFCSDNLTKQPKLKEQLSDIVQKFETQEMKNNQLKAPLEQLKHRLRPHRKKTKKLRVRLTELKKILEKKKILSIKQKKKLTNYLKPNSKSLKLARERRNPRARKMGLGR